MPSAPERPGSPSPGRLRLPAWTLPRRPGAFFLVTGVLILQLAFILSYIGAFHAPKPHRIRSGVVAPAQIAPRITAELNALPGIPFQAQVVASEAQARQMILHRDLDAAVVIILRAGRDRLLVASAAGPSVSTVTTQIAQGIELGRNRQITVVDLRAPNPLDGRGLPPSTWSSAGWSAATCPDRSWVAGGARPATLGRTFIRLGALVPRTRSPPGSAVP